MLNVSHRQLTRPRSTDLLYLFLSLSAKLSLYTALSRQLTFPARLCTHITPPLAPLSPLETLRHSFTPHTRVHLSFSRVLNRSLISPREYNNSACTKFLTIAATTLIVYTPTASSHKCEHHCSHTLTLTLSERITHEPRPLMCTFPLAPIRISSPLVTPTGHCYTHTHLTHSVSTASYTPPFTTPRFPSARARARFYARRTARDTNPLQAQSHLPASHWLYTNRNRSTKRKSPLQLTTHQPVRCCRHRNV